MLATPSATDKADDDKITFNYLGKAVEPNELEQMGYNEEEDEE